MAAGGGFQREWGLLSFRDKSDWRHVLLSEANTFNWWLSENNLPVFKKLKVLPVDRPNFSFVV